MVLGTPAYMSPEQARGDRIDKRTDIWAFGCVLFEMLTGYTAFQGRTSTEILTAILERDAGLGRPARRNAGEYSTSDRAVSGQRHEAASSRYR